MEQPQQQIKKPDGALPTGILLTRVIPSETSSCSPLSLPVYPPAFPALSGRFQSPAPGSFPQLHLPDLSVCVRVHSHADVAVTHQVLQRFRVHTSLCLNAAVSMAAYMGRIVRHLLPEYLVVPVHHMVESMFPVHSNQRHEHHA